MEILFHFIYIIINISLMRTDWIQRELNNAPLLIILILGVFKLCINYNQYILIDCIFGSILFSLPLFVLYIVNDKLIGGGDIKYLFVSGLYLGLFYVVISWFIMLGTCLIWLLYLFIKHDLNRNITIPLGTFISIGNIMSVLFLMVRW